MRAISRFVSFRRALFSSAPVTDWKRRLKSSCRRSWSRCWRSSSESSRNSLGLVKELSLSLHHFGLDGQLLAREAKRLLREGLRHARELEHHAPGLNHGDPALGRALAGAHAGLGRLLRVALVREDVDPDLAAALDLARHRDTSGLDLPVRDPAAVDRLQAVVAELHRRLALRLAGAPAAVHLAELGLLRHEHGSALLRALGRRRGSFGRLLRRSLVRLRLRRLLLVAARAASARGARALPGPAALAGTAAAASATGAAPALAHRPEALTVGSAAAAALAGGAEALDRSAATAARVLVAETRVAGRDALVALGHDL